MSCIGQTSPEDQAAGLIYDQDWGSARGQGEGQSNGGCPLKQKLPGPNTKYSFPL